MNYDHASNESFGNDSSPPPKSNSNGSNGQSSKGKSNSSVTHQCPICRNRFQRSETKTMPFCSVRCQQVDMGRWLNESYGMPHEGHGGPEGFGQPEEMEPE